MNLLENYDTTIAYETHTYVPLKPNNGTAWEGKQNYAYRFVGWSKLPNPEEQEIVSVKRRGRFLYVETIIGKSRYTIEHD